MKREEAKLLGFSKEDRKTEYSGNYVHLDNVIDIIYDSFESKTCENCKYYKNQNCENGESIASDYYQLLDPDFGCNKFIRKDN